MANPALLEAIMKLAQSPVQPLAPAFEAEGAPPPPLLLRRDAFWRATTVITALAAYNFDSLGALVWREGQLPTVRALMEALLTRCAAFPLHQTEDAEQAAAAAASAQVSRTERGSHREPPNPGFVCLQSLSNTVPGAVLAVPSLGEPCLLGVFHFLLNTVGCHLQLH